MVHTAGTAEPAQVCTGVELLRWRRALLQEGGSASALDWLLDLQGGLSWQQLQRLQLQPDQAVQLHVPLAQLADLWRHHRRTHTPLQYLVGRCPWRDLDLFVQPGVLIPRQETELLVELALQINGSQGTQPPRLWADLGTGSGCLAVALARAWPDSQGMAVDRSHEALQQAHRNLQAQQLLERVSLLEGSWWEPLQPHWGQLELVVSNPPYIPTAVWRDLEPVVRDHEPELALSSGSDGLDAIRAIAAGAQAALSTGGWLLLEHHHDQSERVGALLRSAGLEQVAAHADLEGTLRFAAARKPEKRRSQA